MLWQVHQVSDIAFKNLVENNEPIPVPRDVLINNTGVEVQTSSGKYLNAVYDGNIDAIRKLNHYNPVFKDIPNRDLLLYNDHLLNSKINTVIVDGYYGTGKTATVCSHLVTGLLEEMRGRRGIPVAYLTKPHENLGKGYGHLPGDLESKTFEEFNSYFQYFDRFGHPFLADKLMLRNTSDKQSEKVRKLLHVMVFEYLRGRDIEQGWVVLDEAQNTNHKEMESLVSRICDAAKLVIIGDTSRCQIDKRENTAENNGLTFVKDVFCGKKYTGIVTLQNTKHILRGRRVRDMFEARKGSQ